MLWAKWGVQRSNRVRSGQDWTGFSLTEPRPPNSTRDGHNQLKKHSEHLFIWKCTNTAFISSNFNFIQSSQEKQLNIKMWLPQWLTEYRVFRFNIENTRSKSESNLTHVPKPTFENENRMNLHTEEEEKLYRNFWFETNFNTKEQQVTHWIKHN